MKTNLTCPNSQHSLTRAVVSTSDPPKNKFLLSVTCHKGAVVLGMGILLLAWIHTSGCACCRALQHTASGYMKPDPPIVLSENTLQFNYTKPSKTNTYFRTVYALAATNTPPLPDQKTVRNQIIDELIALIDQDFHKFEFNLENFNNGKNLVAALATLGLNAAGTVVGGAETKTILAAVSGGIIGANLAVDKAVFKELAVQSIRNQMRTLRTQKMQDIKTKTPKPVADYTLDAALDDIIDYYYCGYVYRALDELILQSGENLQKARSNYTAFTQGYILTNTPPAITNNPPTITNNPPTAPTRK